MGLPKGICLTQHSQVGSQWKNENMQSCHRNDLVGHPILGSMIVIHAQNDKPTLSTSCTSPLVIPEWAECKKYNTLKSLIFFVRIHWRLDCIRLSMDDAVYFLEVTPRSPHTTPIRSIVLQVFLVIRCVAYSCHWGCSAFVSDFFVMLSWLSQSWLWLWLRHWLWL